MYAPSSGGAEYVELHNTSETTLDLSGVRLSDGISFRFAPGTQLPPDEHLVVTNDRRVFLQEYGVGIPLAGEYDGQLNNAGESLALLLPNPLDTAVLRFEFAPDWYPSTDGQGESLSIIDPLAHFRQWSDADQWLATSPSPGRAAGGPLPNDLDGDGQVSAADIDLVCQGIRNADSTFDLNADNVIDVEDLQFFVSSRLQTFIGDANVDGIFDSQDFVTVFIAGEYVDNVAGNSTWADGDWDCNGEFDSEDIVAAFQAGGYLVGAASAHGNADSNPHGTVLTPGDLSGAIRTNLEDNSDDLDGSQRAARREPVPAAPRRLPLNLQAVEHLWSLEATPAVDDIEAQPAEPDVAGSLDLAMSAWV